jgi:uncharacterized protein (UPF0371 family)
VYHDHKRGKSSAREVRDLPHLEHSAQAPGQLAYEAATADIADYNLIDPFHQEAYGEIAVNYNRDVESFPVLRRILEKIGGAKTAYKSPTDMGVNRAGFGIVDDSVVREAARQEIVRRYFRYSCEYVMGFVERETVQRVELLMKELEVSPESRPVFLPAREAALEAKDKGKGNEGIYCAPRSSFRTVTSSPARTRRCCTPPQPGAQRGQNARRHTGPHPSALPAHHRFDHAPEG